MPASVGNISDTARWVAVYRAMETERPDGHFRDPYARRLAGARGEEILATMRGGRAQAWAFVVRTCSIDALLQTAIERFGADTVVNLAAGLDTRPYRLALPPGLRWYDVDLPGILDYKQEMLSGVRPACELETVRLDLSDASARADFLRRVGATARNAVVITEGLLIYLSREQVWTLAADLHAQPSFRAWILDIVSPDLLRMLQRRYGRNLSNAGAPLKFGPPEGTDFFGPFGWTAAEFRSTFEEAHRTPPRDVARVAASVSGGVSPPESARLSGASAAWRCSSEPDRTAAAPAYASSGAERSTVARNRGGRRCFVACS